MTIRRKKYNKTNKIKRSKRKLSNTKNKTLKKLNRVGGEPNTQVQQYYNKLNMYRNDFRQKLLPLMNLKDKSKNQIKEFIKNMKLLKYLY